MAPYGGPTILGHEPEQTVISISGSQVQTQAYTFDKAFVGFMSISDGQFHGQDGRIT